MKKIAIVLLLALASLFSIDIGNVKATTYTYTADPNYPSNKIEQISIMDYGIILQSFTPTTTTLANYIYAMVDGTLRDPSKFILDLHERAPIPAELPDAPGDHIGTYRATTIGAKPNGMTNSLEMTKFTNTSVTEVNVDTSKKYILLLRYSETYNSETDGDLVWYSDPNGSYGGGYARSMGPPLGGGELGDLPNLNYDFGFAIYNKVAQAEQPPADDPEDTTAPTTSTPTATTTPTTTTTPTATTTTPSASTPLPTGVTAGSGAAPTAPSTSIKAPTAVVVADVAADQGGSLKIDWTASTTADIDGYKIFRSTAEKTGFTEIAKTTDKAIVTYTDNAAAIGQKYYYMVRAYQTTKESASSNTANGTSVDNIAPAIPTNFVFAKNALDYTFSWDKNTETDLSGYSLIIMDDNNKILETIEITKDLNTYELIVGDHQSLEVGAAYQFSLIAKDLNSNLSEKSVAKEKAQVQEETSTTVTKESPRKSPLIWYITGGIAILLLAGGGLYWFKLRRRVKAIQ